ncbi:hypothetical protein T4B_15523 [Trichinella pseudospiralis]|uniref:Uncharacterized protein n=2 Tax=Trichinella pseudospiralis TaxID=6337 RepID=A0A0V1JA33_TRIPS|nr:hypothetical protein T4E_11302 [Trichinella pseudospiralis]KRX95625.1 hypothetical protein T4E_8096 [Trichinella pseudospiralis]KRY65688.1 hypothetical protein T4A_7497 [Trichinella pseudospiralis]KRY65784.1 hypothetical protein T4A_13190 [Trichinella pseudospiralis]KRY86175.1 hypothetical protein T4D_2735 [Trichinella pseudospiralis]
MEEIRSAGVCRDALLPYQKSAFLARFLHGYKASALLSLTVTVSAPHHSASTSRHISSRFSI